MLKFLLLCFVLLTWICFKLGWLTTPPDWRARGGFVLGALLAAATLGVMGVEHGASRRLQAAGIEPHPAITSAKALASGLGRSEPAWVFDLSEPGDQALDFYQDPSRLPSWQLQEDQGTQLKFLRDSQQLTISGSSRRVIFYLIRPIAREEPDAARAPAPPRPNR